MNNQLAVFVFQAIFAFVIAYTLGRKRQIGSGMAFYFSFINLFIGLIIVLTSRKVELPPPEKSRFKEVVGYLFLAFFSVTGILNLILFFRDGGGYRLIGLLGALLFGGFGYYLIGLGKGRVFNSVYLDKV